jgi:hypothetical protein
MGSGRGGETTAAKESGMGASDGGVETATPESCMGALEGIAPNDTVNDFCMGSGR